MKKHTILALLVVAIGVIILFNLPRIRRFRAIGERIMQDYRPIVDCYCESIKGSNGNWLCPDMTWEEMVALEQLCVSNKCNITASADKSLGGVLFGLQLDRVYATFIGKLGINRYPSDTYIPVYTYMSDGSKMPVLWYERRFLKDGHKVTVTLMAWPDDKELRDFIISR